MSDFADNPPGKLLAELEKFAAETLDRADSLKTLAEEVNKLLAESEASCQHPRLKAAYAEAKAKHAGLISDQLALLREAGSFRDGFDNAHYQQRVKEVIEAVGRLKDADAPSLEALGELLPALEPVRDRVMAAPAKVGLTVGAILASPSCLACWHFESLSLYVDRPPTGQRLIEGAGDLLKAALLDAGGSVLPFLGTADVLCQLSVSQISRDRERMMNANDEISRLFFFTDHLSELAQGVGLAKANAKRGNEFIVQANRDFDNDSQWLIEAVGAK